MLLRVITILSAACGQWLLAEEMRPLLDFGAADAADRWQAVNDGVMGGVSEGRFRIVDGGRLEFSGRLSLENNGGFASVRTRPMGFDLATGESLVVRVKGDGRTYVLNLYTASRRMAFSYRADLPTAKDEWTEVRIPLDAFIPTSFGNRVAGMGPVDPAAIRGIGFMLSDKRPGPFRMEVEWVRVASAAAR